MSVQALSCAFAVRGISASEKLVLLALSNFANDKMQCWPSQDRLAADTELSARTVWAAVRGLEEKGLLTRESRKRPDGTRSTDVFTLRFVLTVWSEPVANPANSTRNSCETQSQILQEPVAAVATLTTFEPSLEPSEEEPLPEARASAAVNPNDKAWEDVLGLLVGQGGMKPDRARAFFGGLLKAHGLEPRDLLSAIGTGYSTGTKDPQALLKGSAMSLQRRRQPTGPPKRVGFV